MSTKPSEDQVFVRAAELFGVLSAPTRLKIISAVGRGEQNVSELLAVIETTQPNMSQHLSTLYRSGVLAKRRNGSQTFYRLRSERVAMLCRAMFTQAAIELKGDTEVGPSDRLLPVPRREEL